MFESTDRDYKGRHMPDEQITIDARDVRAGHWDAIHMEARR